MIEYITGDLLSTSIDVDVRVHQVNCKGVMNAGLGKQVRERFPEAYSEYKHHCLAGKAKLGSILVVHAWTGGYICNLFGQDDYGLGKVQTDYNAFKSGLEKLKLFMTKCGLKSLGIPKYIGCGLAGGSWEIVEAIIKELFEDDPDILCKVVEYKFS